MSALRVREIIALLEKMPPDAEVWHEGCDCYGEAHDVVLQEDGSVMITRPPGG